MAHLEGSPPDAEFGRPNAGLPEPDEVLESGETGCGELLARCPAIFRRLPAGAVLGLINTDLGTPEDLPAWCRMVGHEYFGVRPGERPLYLV